MIDIRYTLVALIVAMTCLSSRLPAAAPPDDGIVFDAKGVLVVPAKDASLNRKALTVAAWVRLDSVDADQVFLNQGIAGGNFTFYLFKGRVRMLVRHTAETYTHANVAAPAAETWTHYLGTYDGEVIRLYVDGKLAATTEAPGEINGRADDVFVGSLNDYDRLLRGRMTDIRIWNRALTIDEASAVCAGQTDGTLDDELLARWTADSCSEEGLISIPPATLKASPCKLGDCLINEKGDGFRGIWYYNQLLPNSEYVYKYSGGLGTYCAKHIPFAWYTPEANKTFFCYGGTDDDNTTLYHMVSYYDHATGMVARPTTLLDKKTTDAHDNPVINMDDKGHIWIFSSSHGTGRPSYISRSAEPYDIDQFELVWIGNFSYPQPWFLPGRGFLFLHTYYKGGRGLNTWTSTDGAQWTDRTLVSHIEMGHYQVSFPCGGKVGTTFNMHPTGKGLNWRTNLYYMETDDFGATWKTVDGTLLQMPLNDAANRALVAEYQSKNRNVYMKDVNYDSKGSPIILAVTSGGYESGPKNDPRTWTTLRWTGSEWDVREAFASDNNYDTGPLYVESDTTWRVIAPTQTGPQPYNPGGEIAMWLTEDAGGTWRMVRQMTKDSEFNHTYVRRPVNAQPDFYALWADGHGRQPSKSRLFYCNRDGEVFMLPETMDTPFARAVKLQ